MSAIRGFESRERQMTVRPGCVSPELEGAPGARRTTISRTMSVIRSAKVAVAGIHRRFNYPSLRPFSSIEVVLRHQAPTDHLNTTDTKQLRRPIATFDPDQINRPDSTNRPPPATTPPSIRAMPRGPAVSPNMASSTMNASATSQMRPFRGERTLYLVVRLSFALSRVVTIALCTCNCCFVVCEIYTSFVASRPCDPINPFAKDPLLNCSRFLALQPVNIDRFDDTFSELHCKKYKLKMPLKDEVKVVSVNFIDHLNANLEGRKYYEAGKDLVNDVLDSIIPERLIHHYSEAKNPKNYTALPKNLLYDMAHVCWIICGMECHPGKCKPTDMVLFNKLEAALANFVRDKTSSKRISKVRQAHRTVNEGAFSFKKKKFNNKRKASSCPDSYHTCSNTDQHSEEVPFDNVGFTSASKKPKKRNVLVISSDSDLD
uniref:Uncharacterized protein n=1 Tax=Panagrellus redivivus TaxID=6233 RepID=A0A7E4VRA9_PANRE